MTDLRRFILQALDPDHGSPVIEALFRVDELEDLRSLISEYSANDPSLEWSYALQADEVAAITSRFDMSFDPEGRETCVRAWNWWREVPYLSHEGYELPLLLEGRKPFARMSDVYPPEQHIGEERFDRYVAQGLIHKEVVLEPFAKPPPCARAGLLGPTYRVLRPQRRGMAHPGLQAALVGGQENTLVRRLRAHGSHAVRIRGLAMRLVDRAPPRTPRCSIG